MKINMSNSKANIDQNPFNIPLRRSASISFAGVGRDREPAWTNRFKKDFNDLEYNVNYNLIKGKQDLTDKKLRQTAHSLSTKSYNSTFFSPSTSRVSATRKQTRIQMIAMNKCNNPERINIQSANLSKGNAQGLCPFQFRKTISGKMEFRQSKQLQFNNQTSRPLNLNHVWYSKNTDLQVKKPKKLQNNRCHSFSSYVARKTFEPRQELDKFYTTDKGLKLITPHSGKQLVKIDKSKSKKQLRPRSQSLYNEYDAKRKIMRSVSSYKMSNLKRELVFTKQVISSSRGCYR